MFAIRENLIKSVKLTRNLTTTATWRKEARIYPEGTNWIDAVERKGTKKEWQRVRYKGKHVIEREIEKIQEDDTQLSDPQKAAKVSDEKMFRLRESLLARGFCRESKSYNPLPNTQSTLKTIAESVFGEQLSDDWLDKQIPDFVTKFKLLVRCEEQFDHELPNSELHRVRSLRDVLEYYLTPVRGINSYDQLVRNQDQLPSNLHVIPEPIRFNPEFFEGYDAYPNSELTVRGLRAKKKYPDLKVRVVWPDV